MQWCCICGDIKPVATLTITGITESTESYCYGCAQRDGTVTDEAQMVEKPPATLSMLVKLGVLDNRKLDPKVYRPYYDNWHSMRFVYSDEWGDDIVNTENRYCNACFAGGVMAGTPGGDPNIFLEPDPYCNDNIQWSIQWMRAFKAMEWLRQGEYMWALNELQGTVSMRDRNVLSGIPVPSHRKFVGFSQLNAFLDSMEGIATLLENKGY